MCHNTSLKHTYGKDLIKYNSKTPPMFYKKKNKSVYKCKVVGYDTQVAHSSMMSN